MSLVIATPDVLASAATDLANIGFIITAAEAAAFSTTGVLAAAEDEVSAAIAALFSVHGQGFQAMGAQAAAFHDQFVQALNSAGGAYAAAEAAHASDLLQTIVDRGPALRDLLAGCRRLRGARCSSTAPMGRTAR